MNQTDCHIRKYQGTDLDSLAKIYVESIRHLGPAAYSKNQIEAWAGFARDSGFKNWIEATITFVAVSQNNEIMGFAGLTESGHISAVFVAPRHHRKGVASGLLTMVLDAARSMGIVQITSHASEFSKPLFEKFGFVVSEIERTEVKGIGFSRYAMRANI